MKNSKEEKISIIIPIFNIRDMLEKTLQSVVNQTYKNLEIILVDDGSIDESGLICDLWEKRDNRIKCFHRSNEGVSAARNFGFSKCEGDFILFIDGDDEIKPEMCEKMVDRLKFDNSDVCCCGFYNVFQNKTERIVPDSRILEDNEILHALVTDGTFFTAIWNKMFKKVVLLDKNENFIKFEQEIYVGEDALWLSKVLKNARKVSCLPESLYLWKRRENSATQGGSLVRTDEKYLTVLKAYRGVTVEIENDMTRKIMCKKYLGLSRDCMVQAYKEQEINLVRNLMKAITEDRKKLYGKIDLFMIKLDVCLLLIKLRAPVCLINKVQKV